LHLNKATIIGRVTSALPKLIYPKDGGHPTCSFWVEVIEPDKDGTPYKSYLPVEILGRQSEEIAASLQAGDEVLVDGKLKYRSAGVTKDGKKAGGCVVTSWYVTKGQGATAAVESQN
jgi:single-stranded DNA-binding protein